MDNKPKNPKWDQYNPQQPPQESEADRQRKQQAQRIQYPQQSDARTPIGQPDPVTDDQARLAALYRVTRVLGTSLDLDEVLAQVMDAVIGLTGAERGILVLMDDESKDWKLRVARNIDPGKLSSWEQEISRTIINTAVQNRRAVVTADAQSDPRFSSKASVRLNVLRSIMCAPLLVRGRVIGAIYVDSRIQRGVFDWKDMEMMDAFGTQAAFAIENARVYTRTMQQVQQLTIKLDSAKRAEQVAEITETDYYRQLKAMAQQLRNKPSG